MNKRFIKLGMNYYLYHGSLNSLLSLIKNHHLTIFNISFYDNKVIFCAKVSDNYKLLKASKDIEYLFSTNIINIIKKNIFNYRRIIGILVFIIVLYFLSNTIFEVRITGESKVLSDSIKNDLIINGIYEGDLLFDDNELKIIEKKLRQTYYDKIEWLNIYHHNSLIEVQYIIRKKEIIHPKTYDKLYAHKDGVISYIDVVDGEVVVKENQYVKKGDLLVTNEIIDYKNNIKQTYVEGKIYARTVERVIVSINGNKKDVFKFLRLLMQAREIISKELVEGDNIIEENILQFNVNNSIITLEVIYILNEDITHN